MKDQLQNSLELSFRETSTLEPDGSCIEFLDVNHRIDKSGPGEFVTTKFIEPTARERSFVVAILFIRAMFFEPIVFSEATRMRRFNELQPDYIDTLQPLHA